jgi:hypothetical protein
MDGDEMGWGEERAGGLDGDVLELLRAVDAYLATGSTTSIDGLRVTRARFPRLLPEALTDDERRRLLAERPPRETTPADLIAEQRRAGEAMIRDADFAEQSVALHQRLDQPVPTGPRVSGHTSRDRRDHDELVGRFLGS